MTLRRLLSCFTLVTLLVAPWVAGAKDRSTALQEALDHATVIALGQVERLDLRGERALATFRVEHVARGEPPDVLTFEAEIPPGRRASSVGLSRMLVFLEPTSQQTPRLRVAARGAAALKIFSRPAEAGALFVEDDSWAHLCGPRSGDGGCHTRLDSFLSDAGLRPFVSRREATFRVREPRHCGPCELEEQVGKRIAPASRDCGITVTWKPDPRVLPCVREALAAQAPFHVRVQRRGVDSRIVNAYVSDGSRFFELVFDSSATGGPRCAANVSQRRCATFVFPTTDEEPLRCERPEKPEMLCDQLRNVYALGPAEKISRLTCVPGEQKRAWRCEPDSRGSLPGGRTPLVNGPDYLCSQGDEHLFCYEQ